MLTKHLWVSAVALLFVIGGIGPAALAQEEETIDTRSAQSSALRAEDLGTSSTAVDVWRLDCPSGTSFATADVRDLKTAKDGVLFTVILGGATKGRASLRQAPDGGITSSPAKLALGPGTYWVYIHKNKASSAKVMYDSQMLCDQGGDVVTLGQDQ